MPSLNYLERYQPQPSIPPLLGYSIRDKLFPGEDNYFKANPHVAGMAAETNDIILNPYSPPNINREAVAKNEALRLFMRERNYLPQFGVTDEQRKSFKGTTYSEDDNALRQTLAARIYSGDPSALATKEQTEWVRKLERDLADIFKSEK